MLTVLRMAIKRAVMVELLIRDVSQGVKKPQKIQKAIRILSSEEITKMFQTAEKKDLLPFTALIWNTGLRREEALGLKWSSVDIAKKTLTVESTVVNIGKETRLQDIVKTSHSYRRITLPIQLIELLKRHQKKQVQKRLAAKTYNDFDLVLCQNDGQPFSPRYYTRKFTDAMQLSNEKGITPHVLRHNHATTLFDAGWHAKDVQERLGHASIAITLDIYTHHVPRRENEIAKLLEDFYPPAAT